MYFCWETELLKITSVLILRSLELKEVSIPFVGMEHSCFFWSIVAFFY